MLWGMGRNRESGARLDKRVAIGTLTGPITLALVNLVCDEGARSVESALVAAPVCLVGYCGWVYGRDWYERRLLAKHTYRPGHQ
jgi:hypothetical protein